MIIVVGAGHIVKFKGVAKNNNYSGYYGCTVEHKTLAAPK